MKKICFYVNRRNVQALARQTELEGAACACGLAVTEAAMAEAVIALGGDGTILRAVHAFPSLPVLGLNLGGLGYLSSVEERGFTAAFSALATGRYRLSERTALEVVGENGPVIALNDIVVMREMSGHAAVLDLTADGRPVTRYMADGLVIATPTGSTAYSLSAGGPVLMPDSESFVVTPMNPHALGVRPLVVRDTVRFALTPRPRRTGEADEIGVYADGEFVRRLSVGETLEVAKAAHGVQLVELEGADPYLTLAHKLGWSGTNVKEGK